MAIHSSFPKKNHRILQWRESWCNACRFLPPHDLDILTVLIDLHGPYTVAIVLRFPVFCDSHEAPLHSC